MTVTVRRQLQYHTQDIFPTSAAPYSICRVCPHHQ